ncbi:hypothetical protein, partial [uncultured Reyranella sp.]|uniref:hypothetical protein n=1 Tax=uncultured Reyranella sp. TaxID=735512 RepID=UPI00259CEAD7
MEVELSVAARRTLERGYAEMMWRRAEHDPAFFMRHLMWVQSQRDDRGREPFVLFDYQEDDLDAFVDGQFTIVLKARQLGLSTLVAGYALWLVLFRPGANIVWVSNNQANADKAIAMLDTAWHFLPEWAKLKAPRREGDAASEKVWVHGDGLRSRIKARAGTKTAAASETTTLLVLDEFALVDPVVQKDLYRSAVPTTDAGGKLVIISTARGRHNQFAQLFQTARQGGNRYTPIFHPWFLSRFVNRLADKVKGCLACGGKGWLPNSDGGSYCTECVDTSVYNAKRADFPDEPWLHKAEYPATPEEAFRESGRPRFPWLPPHEAAVEFPHRGRMVRAADGQVRFVDDPTGPLRLSGEALRPERWRRHVVSCDPASGTGGDFTAFTCGFLDEDGLPVRTGFWHANHVEPIEAANDLEMLGRWLEGPEGPATIVVETQGGYGSSFLDELRRSLYPNLYRSRTQDARSRKKGQTYGLSMQWKRKPLIIDRMASFLQPLQDGEARLSGIDPMLLSELESFVRTETGKVQADVGCHDDLVMSCAIWLWVLTDDEVGPATRPPTSEDAPAEQAGRLDVSHILQEAEAMRAQEALTLRRATRRHRTRRGGVSG